VTARDPFGNTTPAFTGAVTVAIGANPGSGALTGTLSHNAVAGIATFNDLQIDQPGIGFTLTAAASGLTGATSATFDMVAAAGTSAWSNPAGGNWSNPANWSGGVVPGPTDIAVITLPGTYTVTFDVQRQPSRACSWVGHPARRRCRSDRRSGSAPAVRSTRTGSSHSRARR